MHPPVGPRVLHWALSPYGTRVLLGQMFPSESWKDFGSDKRQTALLTSALCCRGAGVLARTAGAECPT